MLVDVVGCVDTDNRVFQGGEGEGLGAANGPFIEGTDYSSVSCDCGSAELSFNVLGMMSGLSVAGKHGRCRASNPKKETTGNN